MKIKGLLTMGVWILLAALILSGCGSNNGLELQEGKVNVMTTFYPLYHFTESIGGEHVHVINIVPAGVSSHDWAPKSQDMKHMTKADLLVYNGLGYEGWIDDFFSSLDSGHSMHIVEASRDVDLIHTDDTDEHEEEEAHEDDHGHDHGHVDPHVWLSPLQAQMLAANIKAGLIEVDPEHQADYEANYEALKLQLKDLHQDYSEAIKQAPRKEFVVSHQAFGYLARDYGLTQLPIMGLSPDAEPTAQDMKRISQFVRDYDVKYILFEELVSPRIAETLADNLNIETLVFNPVEGLTQAQMDAGETYFSMMERNLTSLQKALQ